MKGRIENCSPLSTEKQKTLSDIWRRQVELNKSAPKEASGLAGFASLEEIFNYIQQLKGQPAWVEIRIDDGRHYFFARPVATWNDPFSGPGCILSNGEIILSLKDYCKSEDLLLETLLRHLDILDIKNCLFAADEPTRELFPVPTPRCFLEPLAENIVPQENFNIIYRHICESFDKKKSPREILIDEAVNRITAGIYELSRGDILYFVVSEELPSLTLAELIEKAPVDWKNHEWDTQENYPFDPLDPLFYLRTRYGERMRQRGELFSKLDELREAIRNFLSDFDGWEFTPFLQHKALSSTLRHAVYTGHFLPEKRASFLLEEVAQAFGFCCSPEKTWVKTDGRTTIEIYPNSTVFINGHMVCIVPRKPEPLPKGDLIAAKMIFLATSLRNTIYTLIPYRDALARLFPEGEEALKGLNINHLKEVL